MNRVAYSATMSGMTHAAISEHLLRHLKQGMRQEDLCFALWHPSQGKARLTAIVCEPIFPLQGERQLHGNASFNSAYFERALSIALAKGAGLAFLHSHPSAGWQDMSPDDEHAEGMVLAARVFGATGKPLLGMTIGTDESWSARLWIRKGRGVYAKSWCGSVRITGDQLRVTFCDALVPEPAIRDEMLRTVSSWGKNTQGKVARLRVGIIGLGSVGSLLAECLARHGIESVMLMDFDIVKTHNLDRLANASIQDIGRLKVDVASDAFRSHSTATHPSIETVDLSITSEEGFRIALDCDVLFSCVDRPWPRSTLNLIAYAHNIPVIDGGVKVSLTRKGGFRSADWRAHTVVVGRKCLACLNQYDPADVALERTGLLEDPSYIDGLPKDHFVNRSENVFGFSMAAASLEFLQFLAMIVSPYGLAGFGNHSFHFANGSLDQELGAMCNDHCLFPGITCLGDSSGISMSATAADNVTWGN